MNERIYVCHTYYHVYVTVLKELALPLEKQGQATLVLSKLSTDFENLKDRVLATGFFQDVIEFDEKRDTFFPQLAQYRMEQGNIVKNMIARIRFTKLYARLEEPYIPVDFKKYQDIYGREYTCRVDSPGRLIRFQESRGFGYQDETEIRPENNTCRIKGSITIDNSNYSRYCGELQIIREDLPCDERVNVIGNVNPGYIEVIDRITRGKRFRLVVE